MSDDIFETPLNYRDRRASLIISGIILALTGCMIGLMAAFYIVMFGFAGSGIIPAPPSGSAGGTPGAADLFGGEMKNLMIVAGAIYGVMALAFIVVGAGNIFLRRWSRPLALITSAGWAYTGLASMIWTMVSFTKMKGVMFDQAGQDAADLPPGMEMDAIMGIAIIVNLVFIFIFGVMLPALIFWLNLSRDARITVEVCDRKPRWTDRCPVPVLGLAVFAAAGGLMTFATVFWMPFMPVFGHVLTGQKAQLVMGGMAAILLFIAWGAYRRQVAAWALSLVVVIAGTISGIVTFRNFDWKGMYETMGIPIPDDELLEMEKMMDAIYTGNSMIVAMILGALPIFAYLIWVLRFFKNSPDESGGQPAEAN